MPDRPTHRRRKRHGRATNGVLPNDLYAYAEQRAPSRIGRPVKRDLGDWVIGDDWPNPFPVTEAELDLFEAWFGDIFDEIFGPCQ